jgi:metallopeptidase MepB
MLHEKYRTPPQPAPIFKATKEAIVDDVKARCEVRRSILDKLVADISVEQATFHNVLLPLERDDDLRWSSIDPGFYRSVSPDSELRQAALQAQKLEQSFDIECSMRDDVFRLVDAVFNKGETLDPESQRVLEESRRDYIRNGLALSPGSARDRYKAIAERLSDIKTDYQKNVDENAGGIWFTRKEIDGLPQDVIEGLEKGTAENIGKLRVTFKPTDYSPLMRFAQNPETRKRALVERENRASVSFLHLGDEVVLIFA